MLTLAKYTHVIELPGKVYALWNSLWLQVIFLNSEMAEAIQTASDEKDADIPPALIQALQEKHFLASDEDDAKLAEVRQVLVQQPIALLYLILTEGCNFACGYCFLKDMVCNEHALESIMSFETAKEAIDLFKRTLDAAGTIDEPRIIFYGGEPLINWEVMVQSMQYAQEQIPNCALTVNTNGSLITSAIAQILHDMDVEVALSLDGRNHDAYRVNRGGQGTLAHVLRALEILRQHDCSVGISCTVTVANLETLVDDFLWIVDDLGMDSVDFNILLGETLSPDYGHRATAQILECHRLGLERGVKVDRVMRSVEPIAKGRLNLADCGGCGQQLVFTPDGMVGCCHAFLNDRAFFYPAEQVGDPETHPLWAEWKRRSPFNIPECLECEALGICGGGCFYNAYLREGNVWGLDRTNCEFVLATLRVSLADMWAKMQE